MRVEGGSEGRLTPIPYGVISVSNPGTRPDAARRRGP